MKISRQIDCDCKSLKKYFNNLFSLLEKCSREESEATVEAYDADETNCSDSYQRISHLIKPDMLINIYSLLDFWLEKICKNHKESRKLTLSHTEIKGKSDLNSYHKYLTKYVCLNLNEVQNSYSQLDNLRKVRNCFIHSGGHIPENKEKDFAGIKHINLVGSLIYIKPEFIWESLSHAKKYLIAATGN